MMKKNLISNLKSCLVHPYFFSHRGSCLSTIREASCRVATPRYPSSPPDPSSSSLWVLWPATSSFAGPSFFFTSPFHFASVSANRSFSLFQWCQETLAEEVNAKTCGAPSGLDLRFTNYSWEHHGYKEKKPNQNQTLKQLQELQLQHLKGQLVKVAKFDLKYISDGRIEGNVSTGS